MKNYNITSSSKIDSSHDAFHGRLYADASWCSKTTSTSEYIQIDLGQMVTLTGIATQGDHTDDKWVKTYIMKYSIDGNRWADCTDGEKTARVIVMLSLYLLQNSPLCLLYIRTIREASVTKR